MSNYGQSVAASSSLSLATSAAFASERIRLNRDVSNDVHGGFRWKTLASRLSVGRNKCCSVVVGNELFVLGGYTKDGITDSVESLSLEGLSSETDTTITASAAVVASTSDRAHAATTAEQQPQWNRGSRTHAPMPGKRVGFGLAAVSDTDLVIAGGWDGRRCLRDVHLFNIATQEWTALRGLLQPRQYCVCVVLQRKIYVLGGSHAGRRFDKVEVMDLDEYSQGGPRWRPLNACMTTARGLCTARVLPDRQSIAVFGGISQSGEYLRTWEHYNLYSQTWTELPPLPFQRYHRSALFLGDNKHILLLGGTRTGLRSGAVETVEAYHLDTGRRIPFPSLLSERCDFATLEVPLPTSSNRAGSAVLVVGGANRHDSYIRTVEVLTNVETSVLEDWGVAEEDIDLLQLQQEQQQPAPTAPMGPAPIGKLSPAERIDALQTWLSQASKLRHGYQQILSRAKQRTELEKEMDQLNLEETIDMMISDSNGGHLFGSYCGSEQQARLDHLLDKLRVNLEDRQRLRQTHMASLQRGMDSWFDDLSDKLESICQQLSNLAQLVARDTKRAQRKRHDKKKKKKEAKGTGSQDDDDDEKENKADDKAKATNNYKKEEEDEEYQAEMDDDDDMVPSHLLCPITLALMRDPVIAADGHTYEHYAIAKVIAGTPSNRLPRSPMTNEIMDHKILIPALAIRAMSQQFREEHGDDW